MDKPIIRVFLSTSTRSGEVPIYHGPHHTIPAIGERVCVQYDALIVWRVEHILSHENNGQTAADIYVTQNRPQLLTAKSHEHS